MEKNIYRCNDCHRQNGWWSYKWVDSEEKAAHNRKNRTTCPHCGSNNVEDETLKLAEAEAMASYAFAADVISGRYKK